VKKLSLVVSLLIFAIPATAQAKGSGGGHKSPAKYCKALRAQMGTDAFREAFGAKQGKKNAFGRCVSSQRKAKKSAQRRARQACRAERRGGHKLKRCLREKLVTAEPGPTPEAVKDAVEQCQAEQAEDPEGFADEYGPEEAFGKCVAEQISENADEPQAENSDDGADDPGVDDDPGDDSEPADEPDAL
jgi:hypothetical protein